MTLEDQAIKVLDESASDSESNIVDELVKEFPTLAGSLVKTINKRNKTNLEIPKKQRISKNKILLDITSNLSKINGELIITNSRLQAQNDLLRGNLAFTSNSIGNLEYNDTLLTGKLDSVLQALKMQNEFMREKEEDQERDSSFCSPQIIGRIQHFISRKAMDIDGLGAETVALLVNSNIIRNYSDLYSLSVDGIGGRGGYVFNLQHHDLFCGSTL